MKCSFFAACLDKDFKEGGDSLVKLPEDDPNAIEKVLEYLYSGSFEYPALNWTQRGCGVGEERSRSVFLAKCYATADKYCLEDLQNKIMDWVKDAMKHKMVCASGLQELTKAGLRSCPMRRFLLKEMAIEAIRAEAAESHEEGLGAKTHPEHSKLLSGGGYDAEDLFSAYQNVTKQKFPEYPSRSTLKCDWHIHKVSEKCLKKEV